MKAELDTQVLQKALAEIRRLKAENVTLREAPQAHHSAHLGNTAAAPIGEPIAVIGFSCRTPGGGDNAESFWSVLDEERSTVAEVPDYRWSIDKYYDPDPDMPGKMRCRFGSFLGPVDGFDCKLFGISPLEASFMDPQQRLLMEMAWEALEDANIKPSSLKGSRTGVFIGQSGFDFATQHMAEESLKEITPYVGTGCAFSPAAGRISYTFDLKGPSYVVDTACSSSLVAMHNACLSLRQGDSSMALVGAANLILGPGMSINFDKVGMLCEDGVIKTFDEDAHGVVRAEGGGMVVLKRLSDAQRDGDRIDGIIMGSAVSQDGASTSLMAPNGSSQREVMLAALKAAGLQPDQIDLVEAHGTATKMGDPTELNSTLDAYCASPRTNPLLIGSLKTNFGHMEAAAGIVGFIKLLLSLRNEKIPAQLNYSKGHPDIEWDKVSLSVCAKAQSWPHGGRSRIAGLSGFGFSGTNAHVILGDAPSVQGREISQQSSKDKNAELVVLSAASEFALAQAVVKLRGHEAHTLAQLAYTLRTRREALPVRLALTVSDRDELDLRLDAFIEKGRARGVASGRARTRNGRLAAAFVFCGHGAQYLGMGAELYSHDGVFKNALDEALAYAESHMGIELRELLLVAAEQTEQTSILGTASSNGRLDQTAHAQLGLFCVQYALAKQWLAWGVKPKVVMGHSLGEYTAACIAGVFSLEDAVLLVAERGRLMEQLSKPGAMICAFEDEEKVAEIVSHYQQASIAAVNGPGIILISGLAAEVAQIGQKVEQGGGRVSPVSIDRAFHSPLVEPVLSAFEATLKLVTFAVPTIPLISNVTGVVAGPEIGTPAYWLRHLRQPVQFCSGIRTLHEMKLDALIDVSPEPVLMGLDLCYQELRSETGSSAQWVPSLRKGQTEDKCMLDSLGRLFVLGLDVADAPLITRDERHTERLPTYGFDRQRCWSAAAERGQGIVSSPTLPVLAKAMETQKAEEQPIHNDSNLPALAVSQAEAKTSAEFEIQAVSRQEPELANIRYNASAEPSFTLQVGPSPSSIMLEHMEIMEQYLASVRQ